MPNSFPPQQSAPSARHTSYSQPSLDSPETSYIGATSTRSHPTMFSPLQPRIISKASEENRFAIKKHIRPSRLVGTLPSPRAAKETQPVHTKSRQFNTSFPHCHDETLPDLPNPSLCCAGSTASFNGSKNVPFLLGNEAASTPYLRRREPGYLRRPGARRVRGV